MADRIDTAGGSARLFSYELRYIKARDLAERLSEAFASSGNRGGSSPASLAPGAIPSQLGSDGERGMDSNNSSSFGSTPGSGSSGAGNGSMNLPQRQSGNVSVSLEVEGDRVGVSAVEETNTLLVRSTPAGLALDPRGDREAGRDAAAGAHRSPGGRGVAGW